MNLDAYTLRKMAPKILIAVIAVNISIYLCIAAIDATNVLGRGLNQLISAPFNEVGATQVEVAGDVGDNILFWGVAIAGGILTTIALASGQLLPMIGLVLIPIVLAAIAVLVTLIIRKILLVLLTIISPIAFSLWVLPGTEKYFKQWWSLFLKTLMVYPIVAAVFAVTNVMAAITLDDSIGLSSSDLNGGGETVVPQVGIDALVGVMLVFIPLFLVPFAFKFSGGALGALSGQLSNLQKPINRMAGRSRQKRLEKNFARGKVGGLFNTEKSGRRDKHSGYFTSRKAGSNRRAAAISGLRRATTRPNFADLNKTVQAGSSLSELGTNPRRWRERTRLTRAGLRNQGAKDIMENSKDFKNISSEEAILKAMQVKGGRKEVMEEFRAQSGWDANIDRERRATPYFDADGNMKQTGSDLLAGAMGVRKAYGYDAAAQAGVLGTVGTGPAYGTALAAGAKNSSTRKFAESIVKVADGDIGVGFNLLGESLGQAGQKGRVDLQGSASKAGLAIEAGIQGGTTNNSAFDKAVEDWEQSTWENKSPSTLINAHKSSQPQIMRYMDDASSEVDAAIEMGTGRETMDLEDAEAPPDKDGNKKVVGKVDKQMMMAATLSGMQQNIDSWSPEGRQGFSRTYLDSTHKIEVLDEKGDRAVMDMNWKDFVTTMQTGVATDEKNNRYTVPKNLRDQYDTLHRHWGTSEAGHAIAAENAKPPDA